MSSSQSTKPRTSSGSRKTPSSTYSRIEVRINVYDLLPPSRLSSFLWAIGSSPLHTGIVIKDKEYAYGGHDQKGVSGVYWTLPRQEPPGGTFRCELLQGITFRTVEEIDVIVSEAAYKFHGPAYNLLNHNCNHFTSYLCQQLTGNPGPPWLNRAATIGHLLPCLIPRDWIGDPPDAETADGHLVDSDDERTGMMGHYHSNQSPYTDDTDDEDDEIENSRTGGSRSAGKQGRRQGSLTDSSGRTLPVSERAPTRGV